MPIAAELLHLPPEFAFDSLVVNANQVQVTIASTAEHACCPLCQTPSSQVHSQYQRTLADVPCGGQRVVVCVRSHRWRCRVPTCSRRIFAERLDPFASAWSRMTTRLITTIQAIGCATNGSSGARLAHHVGIRTSPSTVIQHILALPDPLLIPPVEIVLDDWSFRRGKRFGSIIVDLQRHCVIDLLPDRTAMTVAKWLQQHPTIHVISRDRSREFARGIQQGAPQARQVVDRFHVLKNLVELLPTILARLFAELRHDVPPPRENVPTQTAFPQDKTPMTSWKPTLSAQAEARRKARQQERNVRFAQVKHLQEQGLTTVAISQQMQMSSRTVRRWLTQFRLDTHRRKRGSEFDQYADYVLGRWHEGCTNRMQLWREIRAQGYMGSYRSAARFLPPVSPADASPVIRRSPDFSTTVTSSYLKRYTLTQLQWFLVKYPEALSVTEQDYVEQVCRAHPLIYRVREMIHQFRRMVHERPGAEALAGWIAACQTSQVKELVHFAKGLQKEWEPVAAGFTAAASNGQTEGQVNKLKVMKRQMYGRAGFVLLRQRVLHSI